MGVSRTLTFKPHRGSRVGLTAANHAKCNARADCSPTITCCMKRLWLPDPAILRRGEVLPCAVCMPSSSAPARQLIAQYHRRRCSTPIKQCRTAAMENRDEQRADDPTIVVEGGLPRAAVVGVLGGGQLGKMLAMEAVRPPFPSRPPALFAPNPAGWTGPHGAWSLIARQTLAATVAGAHGRRVPSARPTAGLPGILGGSSGVSCSNARHCCGLEACTV